MNNFNPIYDKIQSAYLRVLESEESDDVKYENAVKIGDMVLARKILSNHASLKMPNVFKDANGRPMVLFHGSNNFGNTVFDKKGLFYATDSDSRASGYGGAGIGDSRSLNRPRDFEEYEVLDAGNTGMVVRKAGSVLGADLHMATTDDKFTTFNRFKSEVERMNGRINSITSTPYTDSDDSFDFFNRVSSTIYELMFDESDWSRFWNVIAGNEELSDYDRNFLRGLRGIYERYKDVRDEYFDRRREDMDEKSRKFYDSVFRGYDVIDALIGVECLFLPLFDKTNDIANSKGEIINRSNLVDQILKNYRSGIYRLYIEGGDRPLVVDAKGEYWTNILYGDKKMSTDRICEIAKSEGYTSVVIKDVQDPGVQNADGDDFVVFSPNRIKSADVTYDGGVLIPLSRRFDLNNNDIRY